MKQRAIKRVVLQCLRCGSSFNSNNGHPRECTVCRSRAWNKAPTGPIQIREIPLPKVDHSKPLPLKPGPHCPFESREKSHTIVLASDLGDIRYYCASCDAVFSRSGDYLGVKIGIGARR